jgi:hypothetical protein
MRCWRGFTEALLFARSAIREYLDQGEWGEGVESIIVGRITHPAVEKEMPFPDDVQERMDEDPSYKGPFDKYVTYELEAVSGG